MTGTSTPEDQPAPETGFYRAVLEHSEDLITVVGPDGEIRYSSPAIWRLLGYNPQERVGGSIFDLIHPDDRPEQQQGLVDILDDPGGVASSEFRIQHKDGSWRVFHGIGKNLMDDPVINGILVNVRDVTELRHAEAELERTRTLLHEVVGRMPLVLWKVDADGVFELSEGQGLEQLGLEPGEVVGRSVFDVYADDEEAKEHVRKALAGEESSRHVRATGRVFEARSRPLWDGDEVVGAVGLALDVTEWAEQAERAEFHSELLDHVGQAVIATDAAGEVVYWNRTAEEMYGWTVEEAVGRSAPELTVPEPSHSSAEEIMEALRRGERWSGEFVVRRKDGSEFPAFITNVPLLEDGEVAGVIGVSADLTEQKQLEARLRQAQKMEAVGQLAGGIAHDFNNLLTSIGGYTALAMDRNEDEQVSADLTEIREAAERAQGLADKLLALSRRDSDRLQAVDLDAVLTEMADVLRRVMGERIRVELETGRDAWPVIADRGQLEQALINLAVNARDAMPEGGTLRLRANRVTLDDDRVREIDVELDPGDYMRLVVEDTGTGIDPDIQGRIFEPFFTTKEVGEGSGLGLSMVFGAVSQAGGAITLDSQVGRGTRVTVYLPRADREAQRPVESRGDGRSEPVEPVAATPTVLVVEDEPAVLALARRVLERAGYRVVEATTGVEARERFEEEPSVHLIVTDVIMPEMTGPELIQELRSRHPNLRSVFMSGYAADELESRGLSHAEERFLPKPFTPDQLTEAVEDALGG